MVQRPPYRVSLPTVLGLTTLAIILWDHHNNKVIYSMGMGWDTGAPVWPYQTAWLLNAALNAPAAILTRPFFLLPNSALPEQHYPVFLATALLWWWWLGTRIDYGFLAGVKVQRRRLWIACLVVLALACWWAIFLVCGDAWWFAIHRGLLIHPFLYLPGLGFFIWALALSAVSLRSSMAIFRGEWPADAPPTSPILTRGVLAILVIALLTVAFGQSS